jgi:NADP-dependent 3-hydroxy acid dehydrogenase YdfG
MQRFNNKSVVVTGAASGIGKATVKRLLSEGANVVALDVNDSLLNKLNNELNDKHLTIQTLDISNVKAIESFFFRIRPVKERS